MPHKHNFAIAIQTAAGERVEEGKEGLGEGKEPKQEFEEGKEGTEESTQLVCRSTQEAILIIQMAVRWKNGNIESIVFSGHYWDQKDTILTARHQIKLKGTGPLVPPAEVCQEDFWKMLCEQENLGDLVNNLHAVYEEEQDTLIQVSKAVSTGMETMQTLFNKNWIAIR